MKRTIANNAPAAIGPYVHATEANSIIFTSGQIGLNPQDGKLTEGIEGQTKQTLENLKNILESANSDFEHVLKATIYLDDLANFSKVNNIYKDYFNGEFSARSAAEVSKLPMGAKVEIELIAEAK
ncbi:RidA family protein [Companilactobacillus sp. HBUAS56275]|jgi:endoribonuclease L-PSP, putative|uniref:Rid family detoxifying hydrolase n=1 Tax=Candidatus Companilactobacillus pullicola TaxID=2838523 RepID=A0A9D1ZMJ6_9LACO|nr:Rid family detoxifying hydrolase [Candidatus Companilactobacillus pullicola]